MYERDVGTGTVGWDPDYPDIGAEVMADHPDCPVDVADDVKASDPVKIDDQTATEITDEYISRLKADPDISLPDQ